MIDILLYSAIGMLAGFLGGLLGIGGSAIILPGLILAAPLFGRPYTGQLQHLYQAGAMLCNFAIAAPAAWAHLRAHAILPSVVARLAPAALLGLLAGVALSNTSLFAHQQGRYLAYLLAAFLLYVAFYNLYRIFVPANLADSFDPDKPLATSRILLIAAPTGIIAGLLGIGGGALFVPTQQVLLKIPLRRAIANSAATITFTAAFGAVYKTLTLPQHGHQPIEAVHLALALAPAAVLTAYLGGRLAHKLPRKTLRIIFILFMTFAAIQTARKAASAPAPTPASSTAQALPSPSPTPSPHTLPRTPPPTPQPAPPH